MFEVIFIFLIIFALNVTAFCFMIRNFFRKGKISGKNSVWSTITKIFSVLLNLLIDYGVFWELIFSICFIRSYGLVTGTWKIYISEFNMGFIFLETAFFVPYVLNVLLYKFWYRKFGLSKWWTFPALLTGALAFIITVSYVLSNDYISGWTNAEWLKTPYWIHFPQLP